jgi:hypothetical protein
MYMAHKTQDELRQALRLAAEQVEVGARYAHYKHPGLLYKVTGFAILEATDDATVLYKAQYGAHIMFARPLTSWLETVEWHGKIVPRFVKATDK